jgi:hypothetical protein
MTADFYEQPKLAGMVRPTTLLEAFHIRRSSAFNQILSAHRSAFEAEKQGRWHRADFYWEEVARLFQSVPETDASWSEAARVLFEEGGRISTADSRRQFRDRILLGSHAGFFRGQIQAGIAPQARPNRHLRSISEYIRNSPDIDSEAEARYVDPLAALGLEACRAKFPDQVLTFLLDLAEFFPRQVLYQNVALVEIHVSTSRELQKAESSARAGILERSIGPAERIRTLCPSNLDAYLLLENLCHEQAICFANQGVLKGAFLAIKKTEIYGGPSTLFVETRKQLEEILAGLKQKAETLRATVRATPGMILSAQGQQFVDSVSGALTAGSDWERSPAARTIGEWREKAGRQPGRALHAGDTEALPLIRPESISLVGGTERVEDWLASKRGAWMRRQLVATALMMLLALGLVGREQWAGHARRDARDRANLAIAAHRDAEALDALADYFSAPRPLRWRNDSDQPVVDIYSRTLARWVAAKSIGGKEPISQTDARRLSRYKSQILDKGLDQTAEVIQ